MSEPRDQFSLLCQRFWQGCNNAGCILALSTDKCDLLDIMTLYRPSDVCAEVIPASIAARHPCISHTAHSSFWLFPPDLRASQKIQSFESKVAKDGIKLIKRHVLRSSFDVVDHQLEHLRNGRGKPKLTSSEGLSMTVSRIAVPPTGEDSKKRCPNSLHIITATMTAMIWASERLITLPITTVSKPQHPSQRLQSEAVMTAIMLN